MILYGSTIAISHRFLANAIKKNIRNYFNDNFCPSVMMCDDNGMDEFVKILVTSLDKIAK